MRIPEERRAEIYLEGLRRIALAQETDYRRFLLTECLESYSNLEEVQKAEYQKLVAKPQYVEVHKLMITTYERGMLRERLAVALRLLERRFGSLSNVIRQRVEARSPEQLIALLDGFAQGKSLKHLGLEE